MSAPPDVLDEARALDHPMVVDLRRRIGSTLGSVGARARVLMIVLSLIVVAGVFAWIRQARTGLGVTGLNDRVVWGLYIATFVFFIGISMAGTLISAILRLARAEWRRPITRVAEAITVASLVVALMMIAADMGRPDRLLTVLWRGNLRSPIVWDVLSITTYLIASLIYLGLPLIPDLALLRDRGGFGRLRSFAYRMGSLGWTGRADQRRRLERALVVTSLTVIPAAIAVHSVTAWLFGMTLREGWNSPLMAPYFVASAAFSGTAVILLALAVVRRVYGLRDLITAEHLAKLGRLLLIFGIGYGYLTFAEYLTGGFKLREGEDALLYSLVQGDFAPLFWASLLIGTIIPIALLASRNGRKPRAVLVASTLVVLGMMVKRFLIVVPSLGLPLMPTGWAEYRPTPTEILITAAAFAAFGLILLVLAHAVPIVSVTEVAEGFESETPDEEPPAPSGPPAGSEGDAGDQGQRPHVPKPRARSVGRLVRRISLAAGLLVAIPGIAMAMGGGDGGDRPPGHQGKVRVDVVLEDATGRTLPGALVDLVMDVELLGSTREAILDESRTDETGRATLWYRPTERGRFEGRVRFAGAGLWSGTEAPVVFKVEQPLWHWSPTAHGPDLPWLRAWLVLIPAAIVWGLLVYAVWQAIAIRFRGRTA